MTNNEDYANQLLNIYKNALVNISRKNTRNYILMLIGLGFSGFAIFKKIKKLEARSSELEALIRANKSGDKR